MDHEELGAFYCPTPFSTRNFAQNLSRCTMTGDVIVLQGNIGAGKTTFARALIEEVASPACVPRSPTFPLIQEYKTPSGRLLHCDFYRLQQKEEDTLGFNFEEALDRDIILIEWVDRLPFRFLGRNCLTIKFEERSMGRLLRVLGNVPWRSRIVSLAHSTTA
jgi:tRNA threonylcarbamoyl adenosine modification protein YjeE